MSRKAPSSDVAVAAGVSYASLVLTHLRAGEGLRRALSGSAAKHLPMAQADLVDELLECPYCVSFWLALVVARGNVARAVRLAGLASIPTSLALPVISVE